MQLYEVVDNGPRGKGRPSKGGAALRAKRYYVKNHLLVLEKRRLKRYVVKVKKIIEEYKYNPAPILDKLKNLCGNHIRRHFEGVKECQLLHFINLSREDQYLKFLSDQGQLFIETLIKNPKDTLCTEKLEQLQTDMMKKHSMLLFSFCTLLSAYLLVHHAENLLRNQVFENDEQKLEKIKDTCLTLYVVSYDHIVENYRDEEHQHYQAEVKVEEEENIVQHVATPTDEEKDNDRQQNAESNAHRPVKPSHCLFSPLLFQLLDYKMTYFDDLSKSYVDVDTKNGIDTQQFLEATEGVVELFELLQSTAFTIVQNDMNGNIKKIRERYNLNPEVNATLQSLMAAEAPEKKRNATQALLWLTRGLDFTAEALVRSLDNKGEELNTSFTEAYGNTLKKYHNFVVKGAFGLAMKACPYREAFYQKIGVASDAEVEKMKKWVYALKNIIRIIQTVFEANPAYIKGM
ncbi:hypothetical protein [Parasitella parasitica]|uniref:Glycolipid transfer protein domain-containing protein n=1 Tax=Parasitella parasitica TaxID=35722 RepID=A0A0B7NSS2_9FUNG|nr:hypothetical protein [Parasitella parasitica]